MSITYFEQADGPTLVITNTLIDFDGSTDFAANFLIDDLGQDIQIFFDNSYPSSLLPGSVRMFMSGDFPRVFGSGNYHKRTFKS